MKTITAIIKSNSIVENDARLQFNVLLWSSLASTILNLPPAYKSA